MLLSAQQHKLDLVSLDWALCHKSKVHEMKDNTGNRLYRFTFVLTLALVAVAAFLLLIRAFLIDIVLAAIFAGLIYPIFDRIAPAAGGQRAIAAATFVVATLLAVALPFAAILTLVATETAQVSGPSLAWVKETVAHPEALVSLVPSGLMTTGELQAAVASLAAHLADIVNTISGFLSRSLPSVTRDVVHVLLDVLVIAFGMFCFLQNGKALIHRVMERIPVERDEAHIIVDRTLRITAATLKSIVIVGTAQGVLVGIGFAVAGLGQPWLWGTVAAVASAVPGLGSGLVWAPAAIYLLLTGHMLAAVGLALWGVAVVSIADNLLRLYIVGRGAAIPSFLLFVSTLGGLATLGPAGLLIGPVLSGVLIGVLDLYYAVLKASGLLSACAE